MEKLKKFGANSILRNMAGVVLGIFIGGIKSARMTPAPVWFNVLDLTMAYTPMAIFGYKLGYKKEYSISLIRNA